jgi:hypothetical protein
MVKEETKFHWYRPSTVERCRGIVVYRLGETHIRPMAHLISDLPRRWMHRIRVRRRRCRRRSLHPQRKTKHTQTKKMNNLLIE